MINEENKDVEILKRIIRITDTEKEIEDKKIKLEPDYNSIPKSHSGSAIFSVKEEQDDILDNKALKKHVSMGDEMLFRSQENYHNSEFNNILEVSKDKVQTDLTISQKKEYKSCHYGCSEVYPQEYKENLYSEALCEKGHSFCLNCDAIDHSPCICSKATIWIEKCNRDEVVNLTTQYFKQCPYCEVDIEKPKLSNQIICKGCDSKICWFCTEDWESINHRNCSVYNENKYPYDRFLHFYDRYINYINSADVYAIDNLVHQDNRDVLRKDDCFISAKGILSKARQVLAWSFAFAYYLKEDKYVSILNNKQSDLELQVERLGVLLNSSVFEKGFDDYIYELARTMTNISEIMGLLFDHVENGVDTYWNFALF